MATKGNYPSGKLICTGIKELAGERRDFFLRWLDTHIRRQDTTAAEQILEGVDAWLQSHSLDEAIAEHRLMMAELNWCATVSLHTLRRISSAERLNSRRSLDDE